MFYLTDFSIIFVVDNSAEWIWRAIGFCDGEQELGILVVGWISCPKTKTGLIFSILLHLLPGEINMEEFVDGCLRCTHIWWKKHSETAGRFFPFLAFKLILIAKTLSSSPAWQLVMAKNLKSLDIKDIMMSSNSKAPLSESVTKVRNRLDLPGQLKTDQLDWMRKHVSDKCIDNSI